MNAPPDLEERAVLTPPGAGGSDPAEVDRRAAVKRRRRSTHVGRAVMLYALAAATWILVGGLAADALASSADLSLITIELVKGLLFVAVTSLVLAVVLRRWSRRMARASVAEERANREFAQAQRDRSRFLRNVSHELRTPLTNIVGYTATMRAHLDVLDREQLDRCLDRLVVNTHRLERLVLNVLELELSPDDSVLELQPVAVGEVIKRTVRRARTATHRLTVRVAPTDAVLDEQRLERIVEELVGNAMQHTPAGTTVSVTTTPKAEGVEIRVEDDGPGVDPDLEEIMFESFTQGAWADSAASPGLGLGLARVRKNARIHGGDVRYLGRPGDGACFVVWLPLLADQELTEDHRRGGEARPR